MANETSTPRMTAARSCGLAAAVLAVYLGSHLYTWSRGFWSGDSGCKLILVESILRANYRAFSVPYPGRALDPALAFVPLREPFAKTLGDEIFVQYSPVFAIASSVPYRLFGFAGLFVLPLVAGLATLPAVARLAALASPDVRARTPAVLLAAFATPCWFYSLTFWEMTPAVCLATWAAVFTLRSARGDPTHASAAALAGGLAGLAIWFRDDLYVFATALVFALWQLRARRALPRFGLALVAALVPLWAFQAWALGSPIGLHFGETSSLWGATHWSQRGEALWNLVANASPSARVSAAVALTPALAWAASARLSPRGLALFAPAVALVAALVGSVVLLGWVTAANPVTALLDGNSLFAAAPFATLAFVRWRPDVRDESASTRTALRALIVLYAMGYALLSPLVGTKGIHWGGRFLLAAYPVLAALAGVALAEWRSAARGRGSFETLAMPIAAVVALSVGMQIYSLHLLRHRKALSERLNRAVAERPEDVVIASGWPVPQELAQNYFAKTIFLVRSPAELRDLSAALVRAGRDRAVRVSWPPASAEARDGSVIVADPWSFPSFEVRPVRLTVQRER